MRYAIFSDVHANRQAWEAVLEDIAKQGADTLVCLGDVVGYGPKPLEVLSAVRAVTANFVLGNHDAAACGRLDPPIFNERARIVIEWTREQLDEDALTFLTQVPLQMNGEEVLFSLQERGSTFRLTQKKGKGKGKGKGADLAARKIGDNKGISNWIQKGVRVVADLRIGRESAKRSWM